MSEFDTYIKCLYHHVDIQYKKISLCDLSNFNLKRKGFQVHSDGREQFSQIYYNINDAVKKFIELKQNYDKPRNHKKN